MRTRRIDAAHEGRGGSRDRTITERYLTYAYEMLTPACTTGPNGELVMGMASVFGGGTLVMDGDPGARPSVGRLPRGMR